MSIDLKQTAALPGEAHWNRLSHWVILFPVEHQAAALTAIPCGEVVKHRMDASKGEPKSGAVLQIDLSTKPYTSISVLAVAAATEPFAMLTCARQLTATARKAGAVQVGVCLLALSGAQADVWAEAVLAALLAGAAEMPNYKRHTVAEKSRLRAIHLYGYAARHRFQRTLAEAEGNALARYLTHLPGNELTPDDYRRRVERLTKQHGWRMQFLDLKSLRKRGAGAFLAVAQGSPVADAGIVHLHYRPPGKKAMPRVALVGKGICFDTGGVNVKAPNAMRGMHKDMQGSAVALGTFLALAELKVDFAVDCWLALAANHIGPNAYKPSDVVRASDGTTIEIIHTDAEGRMVLADTLAIAAAEKPNLIIDYATLTGACKQALGSIYTGIFTPQREWVAELIEIGRASGERVWPFPLDSDYDKGLESKIADVKQCAEDLQADHIVATRFLQRFVPAGVHWLHLDLSSGTHPGGFGHIPTDITGFGVRFTLHALLDAKLHLRNSKESRR